MRRFFYRLTFNSIFLLLISSMISYGAYASYKRCWIDNGIPSINCTFADGYFFQQEKNTYKKCTVSNGYLNKKSCHIEDGYAMILQDHRWYQCLIQNGKKTDECTLTTGYQVIFLPHLPAL